MPKKEKIFPPYYLASVSGSSLIAEYLGWKNRNEYYQVPNLYPISDYDTGWTECLPAEMEFDKRWDWLMPVIEKIITEEKNKNGDDVIIRTFGMINGQGKFLVRFDRHSLFQEDNLIDASFKAVVDFLQNRL